jgi:hypothetical protein
MVKRPGWRISSFHPSQVRSLGTYDGRRRDALRTDPHPTPPWVWRKAKRQASKAN